MSAVISVVQRSGMGYSATDVAKNVFYFLPIDSNIEEPTDYKLIVPVVGTVYSYEVWLFFRCDVAPTDKCNNFKIWVSGSLPNGQNITVNSSDITEYTAPVNSKSVAGTRANLMDFTSTNKLPVTGTLRNVGDKTNFIVLQLEISSTAEPGDNSLTVFYEYEES